MQQDIPWYVTHDKAPGKWQKLKKKHARAKGSVKAVQTSRV